MFSTDSKRPEEGVWWSGEGGAQRPWEAEEEEIRRILQNSVILLIIKMEEDENIFGEEENEDELPVQLASSSKPKLSDKLKHVNWRVAMTSASKGQEQRSDMKAFFQC